MATTTTQNTKNVSVKTTNAGNSKDVQNVKVLKDAAEIQARANAQQPIRGWVEAMLPTDPSNPSITAYFLIAVY